MYYSIRQKTLKKAAVAKKARQSLYGLAIIAAAISMLAVPMAAQAKGGVKVVDPNCSQIQSFLVSEGQQIGGYGIKAEYNEQQCVSGKTRVKITAKNTATGRIEASTPLDFDRNSVIFYAVARDTVYDITITITKASDNSLIDTETVSIRTALL